MRDLPLPKTPERAILAHNSPESGECRFSTLVPGGVTLNEFASNTGVPGVTNFPVGFAFAGNCLAVAGGDQDQ
jgi:hypothetical protein